ncbi:MAG: hypothetical protein HQK96_04165 [Nitrospirae bacterium]|nr:hypothetical protein [Nitrospirota bacterium]MBF0553733.1 hypothetical protein [Nitrospirota bacterium]
MVKIKKKDVDYIDNMTVIDSLVQDLSQYDNKCLMLYENGFTYMKYYDGDESHYYKLSEDEVAEVEKNSRRFLNRQAVKIASKEEGREQIERYGWNLETPDGDEIDDDYEGDCWILSYSEYYGPYVDIGWVRLNNFQGEKVDDENVCHYNEEDALTTSDIHEATVFTSSAAREWVENTKGGARYTEHNQVDPTRYIIISEEAFLSPLIY